MNRRHFVGAAATLAGAALAFGFNRVRIPDRWPPGGQCRARGGPCDGELFIGPQVPVGQRVSTQVATQPNLHALLVPAHYRYAGNGIYEYVTPARV